MTGTGRDGLISEVAAALGSAFTPHHPVLHHATRRRNLVSIMTHGICPSLWGAVHGGTDIHPADPCVYLSRAEQSDALPTKLFDEGEREVVVLDIDSSLLDPALLYPDDFLYELWAREEFFADAADLAAELELDGALAGRYFAALEAAGDKDLPELMKPLWRWYLSREGEVAYTGVVPAAAILGVRDFGEEPAENPCLTA